MKIINLKQFKKMPVGTVFAKYQPCVFNDLMVLRGHSEVESFYDFYYDSIIGNVRNDSSSDFVDKCRAMEKGESCKLDFEFTGRDGCFDENQLSAIYEKQDVIDFIYRLTDSLIDSFGIGLKDL